MEYINEITIQGIVGNIHVQTFETCMKMARFSVATNKAYPAKGRAIFPVFNTLAGTVVSATDPVIETTWHNVIAWENPDKPGDITDLSAIRKGDKVKITGSIRQRKYTAADGSQRYSTEILAKTLLHVIE